MELYRLWPPVCVTCSPTRHTGRDPQSPVARATPIFRVTPLPKTMRSLPPPPPPSPAAGPHLWLELDLITSPWFMMGPCPFSCLAA